MPGARGRVLDPARRRQRGALRRASTSASSPTTTATRWSRTAAGSPPRSASPRSGSRSAARSTAPSWPSTPRRRSRARSREPGSAELAEVDGHVIAEPGLAPLVFVADCLPVALAGPGGVAMLHCGWRGLAAGIVARGAEAVGATDAAIGPGIGPCCYEVGEEVLGAFAGLGEGIADGRMLDLPEVARRLLARPGSSGSRRPGSARAARRSSSSPTAATPAAPGARPGSSGSSRGG